MLLNAFIAAYIPFDLRGVRDFESGRGWADLVNLLLRKLEREGLFVLGRKKEIGVEVSNDYWITPPSDFRKILEIYYPPALEYTEKEVKYRPEIIQGKIKIYRPFDNNEDPDTFTLSEGSTTSIKIDDADATEDQWQKYLLVLTDGTYSGDTIIIITNDAADGGTAVCNFLHTQDNTIDSTAGYLTDQYLMLKYMATYTDMTAYNGEIPIDDKYESILEYWLCMKSVAVHDKRFAIYKKLFDEAYEEVKTDQFTPTEDQLRPVARSLPGLEDCDSYDTKEFDYIGEED